MTMTPLRLSVLDQSVSVSGSSEDAAIRDTLDLAQHCERLGYERFWVSAKNLAIFGSLFIGLSLVVGLLMAILLDQKIRGD